MPGTHNFLLTITTKSTIFPTQCNKFDIVVESGSHGFMDAPSFDDFSETALLRAARALLGLRQEELAQRAGVTRQIVLRIEKGDLGVSRRSAMQVKHALIAAGVVFIPPTADWPAGVGLRRDVSQ